MRPYRRIPTLMLRAGETTEERDLVAIESALEVRLGKEFLAAFVCSPGLERELTIGYLLSSGIVESADEIDEVRYSANRCTVRMKENAHLHTQRGFSQIRRFVGTECSAPEILRELRTAGDVPSISGTIEVKIDTVLEAASILKKSQEVRRKTGAMHGAILHALSSDEYVIAEDLGRHNAVDKTIGLAVKRGLVLSKSFILSTGRLTADVVSKCAWTSIPMLASFSVATDAGVKFAEKASLTLIGALRGTQMRVYHRGAAQMQ